MASNSEEYKLVCATLEALNLKEYQKSFFDNKMTDESTQMCLTDQSMKSFLKPLIPELGNQAKFVREFSLRAGLSPEPNLKTVKQEKGEPSSYAQIVMKGEAVNKAGSSRGQVDANRAFVSQKRIWNKNHADSLKTFREVVSKCLNDAEDFLDADKVEELLKTAMDTTEELFLKLAGDMNTEDEKIEEEMDKLLKTLEAESNKFRSANENNRLERERRLLAKADEIRDKHIDLVRQKVGKGIVEKDQLDAYADEQITEAEEEFSEVCGQWKCYDADMFYEKMEEAMKLLWIELEARNIQLEAKTNQLTAEILKMLEDGLQGVLDQEELNHAQNVIDVDIEAKVAATEELDNESKRICLRLFLQRSPTIIDAAKTFVAEKGHVLLKKLETLRKVTVEAYKQDMEKRVDKGLPFAEEALQSFHAAGKLEAQKRFQKALGKLEEDMKIRQERSETLWTDTETAMDKVYDGIKKTNSEKLAECNENIDKLFENYTERYGEAMDVIADNSKDAAHFHHQEKEAKDKLIKEFRKQIASLMRDPDSVKQRVHELSDALSKDRAEYLEVLKINMQINGQRVEQAMFEAKKYYYDQMDKKFNGKDWLEPDELRLIHEQVLKYSVEACKAEVPLTKIQEEQLIEAMESWYVKYCEDNERRCPHKEPAIGIDLGTTYSCVGVFFNGNVKIIPNINLDEKTTIPSYVAFNDDGSIDVGFRAKELANRFPENTIFDAKRLIGRKFADQAIQDDLRKWPFDVVDVRGQPRIRVRGRDYRPEEISAKVLGKLKEIAEGYLGRTVTQAVVTVPAYFGDAQKKATKDAAAIAKLNATIIPEPTAAAIAYQLHRTGDLRRNVLIFDLGGGTFDVAVLTIEKGIMRTIAINGDTHLGGVDFDKAMVDALVLKVKEQYGIDLARGLDSFMDAERRKTKIRLQRMRAFCEDQKKKLSDTNSVKIEIHALDDDFDLEEDFTREEFDAINMPLFERCIVIVDTTLKDAEMDKSQIHDIVLVGGSTRIPKIQEMLSEYFGGRKVLTKNINPDEAVAWGAAFNAALLNRDQIQDERNQMTFADIDVTPKSLGVAGYLNNACEGYMRVIIPKNTRVPCSISTGPVFTTIRDQQTVVDVEIYEGEEEYVKDNVRLGRFQLLGIPAAPAGQELLECTMSMDKEGILSVEAHAVTNGVKQKVRIETHTGRMTEVERQAAMNQPLLRWK